MSLVDDASIDASGGVLEHMARWPDNWQSNAIALAMILIVLPLLCALAWWYING